MRRRTWGLLLAAAVFTPVAPARATVPVVIIDGRGWGHGVGMAQDGAFWMAKAGASTSQILGQFYPGAAIGKATGTVRVGIGGPATSFSAVFPTGGRIDEVTDGRQQNPFPVTVDPGGRVDFVWANGHIVVASPSAAHSSSPTTTTEPTTTTTAPIAAPPPSDLLPTPTTTTTPAAQPAAQPSESAAATPAPADSSIQASTTTALVLTPQGTNATIALPDRKAAYRGVLDMIPVDGGVHLVNRLDVEQYLRGMGEVRDPSWPQAALRTQAIAARTYAMRAMSAGGELCDTTRCQVYLGAQAEYAQMDQAVSATSGQVLTYNKALASAVYSANAGGQTATPEEGFGTAGGGYPYLRSAPYVTKNPMPWTVDVGLDDLGAHLGHIAVASVAVASTGPSGRALTVTVTSPDGTTRTVSGRAFAAALNLRSTMFTVRMGTADAAPPPIAGTSTLQIPPDELTPAAAAAVTDAVPTEPALAAEPAALPDRLLTRPLRHSGPPTSTSVPIALMELAAATTVLVLAAFRRPLRRRVIRE